MLNRMITSHIGGRLLKKSRGARTGRNNLNTFRKYGARRIKRRVLGRLQCSFFTNWLVPIFFLIVWVGLVWIDWNGTTHK